MVMGPTYWLAMHTSKWRQQVVLTYGSIVILCMKRRGPLQVCTPSDSPVWRHACNGHLLLFRSSRPWRYCNVTFRFSVGSVVENSSENGYRYCQTSDSSRQHEVSKGVQRNVRKLPSRPWPTNEPRKTGKERCGSSHNDQSHKYRNL